MMAAVAGGLAMNSQVLAQADFTAGIGFMERSDTAYGFIKADGVLYEDELVIHKIGLEYIGYGETLDRSLDTDLLYTTFVANYELEYKASEFISLFIGGGAGVQFVDLDSPVGSLDDDTYGYAQVFGGLRAKVTPNLDLHLGVRRMFFDEASLLGVSGIKQEQTWGVELGFTYRF